MRASRRSAQFARSTRGQNARFETPAATAAGRVNRAAQRRVHDAHSKGAVEAPRRAACHHPEEQQKRVAAAATATVNYDWQTNEQASLAATSLFVIFLFCFLILAHH